MLATNFGSLWPEVTSFDSQNFGYQICFCTRLFIVLDSYGFQEMFPKIFNSGSIYNAEIAIWQIW